MKTLYCLLATASVSFIGWGSYSVVSAEPLLPALQNSRLAVVRNGVTPAGETANQKTVAPPDNTGEAVYINISTPIGNFRLKLSNH